MTGRPSVVLGSSGGPSPGEGTVQQQAFHLGLPEHKQAALSSGNRAEVFLEGSAPEATRPQDQPGPF